MESLEQLWEDYDALSQQAGELEAEHRSETAAFGDSWPGAQIQVRRAKDAAAEAMRRIKAHPDYVPYVPPKPVDRLPEDDDIPF